jgi:hypothetical protein
MNTVVPGTKESTHYIGNELDLFKYATHWKRYWGKKAAPFIRGHVIEVGAGLGGTTSHLATTDAKFDKWVCLEPDPALGGLISQNLDPKVNPLDKIDIEYSYLSNYQTDVKPDTILYIDVIEHIQNDRLELLEAAARLTSGGHLIVLVPAHNFLFSNFDKAIGHYRRYNKRMLKEVLPPDLKLEKLYYLDSVGLFASLANKLLLKSGSPTIGQIKFWNKWMIPVSTLVDKLLFYSFGKSLLLIATKR